MLEGVCMRRCILYCTSIKVFFRKIVCSFLSACVFDDLSFDEAEGGWTICGNARLASTTRNSEDSDAFST